MASIRCLQIQKGLGNPFADPLPRLEYVLVGIKRTEAQSGTPTRPRLPILRQIWLTTPLVPNNVMLWAAACTGFFGFLRAGEFTVPSPEAYDPDVHLNLSDLAVDSHCNPLLVQLRIKQSKTDPFRKGIDIFLGSTGMDICPVQAIIQYLCIRNPDPGPLFMPAYPGLPRCNGHSFRIGAATTAAQQGLQDSLIQTLGRWCSDAFKIYINS